MPAEEMAAEEEAPTPWYDTGVVWYGKLNGGVLLGGNGDGEFASNGSRWGVKGAHELSEGLSAVYNFEASIDTANATTLDNNRLSYMGLSGGFGNLTMGRIWSASENNAGGWRFLNPWHGSSDTTGRISNAVSYSFSSEMASFQVDAVMGPQDTGNTVDELGFGATINLGDIGRLGFAHRKVEDTLVAGMATPGAMPTAPTTPVTPTTPVAPADDDMMNKSNSDPIQFAGLTSMIHEPGTLEVWQYVHTPADGTAKTVVELYRVPAGNDYYASTDASAVLTDNDVGETADTLATYFDDDKNKAHKVSTAPSKESKVIGGALVAAKDITVVTLTPVAGDRPQPTTYYRVSKGNKYYRTTDTSAADETSNKHMEYSLDNDAPAAFDAATVMLTRVKADGGDAGGGDAGGGDAGGGDAGGGDAGGGDAGGGDAGGMMTKTEVDTPGHTENHVTLQVNLGAMTGTLGYTEKDRNGATMDEKTTFVGLNGAIGDTGMSWTAFSRSVDNAKFKGKDVNSWGASLSKSLGTGTSVYIDYGDDGDDGTTFAGLSVSF